jgi:hypothetical protein
MLKINKHIDLTMIAMDLTYLYEFSKLISKINYIEDKEPIQARDFDYLSLLKTSIEMLMVRSIYVNNLSSCAKTANNFLILLSQYIDKNEKNPPTLELLKWSSYEFEIALKSALTTSPAYIITPKGAYDVNILTKNPSLIFHHDLLKLAPEVEYDVEQAAKCLAFEVPTAAGFHLHRINEAVIHRYWDARTHGKDRPEKTSVGSYLNSMKSNQHIGFFEDTILSILSQINNLHRNPVLHPEISLSPRQAIDLFGIINSSVSSMICSIMGTELQEVIPV